MRFLFKRLFLACLALVVLSQPSACAAQTTPEAVAAAEPSVQTEQNGSHFLWRVDFGNARVYLLGSIHLLDQSMYPLPPVMEEAFAESSALVLEADAGGEPNELGAKLQEAATYTDGLNLEAHLEPEDFARLEKSLRKYGIDIASLQLFRPWFASMVVGVSALMQMGFLPQYGIDMHFLEQAHLAGKPVLELESMEYQVQLFSKLSDQDQVLLLRETLEELDLLRGEFAEVVSAWRNGDIRALEAFGEEPSKKYPELDKLDRVLVDERNAAMAEKIAGFLKTDRSYFVVVGAAHLVGERGIVALLRNRGYAVNQL